MTLAWTAATDNVGVTSYRIYRNKILIASLSASALNYTDNVVTPDTIYDYGISAGDAAGNWSKPSTITVKVFHSATLQWDAPTKRISGAPLPTNEIGGYDIRYIPIAGNTYSHLLVNAGSSSATIEGLFGAYNFEIATYDINGVYSDFVPAIPF